MCHAIDIYFFSFLPLFVWMQLVTDSTWEYKIPSSKDIPLDFRTSLLPNSSNPSGFLRSKVHNFCFIMITCKFFLCQRLNPHILMIFYYLNYFITIQLLGMGYLYQCISGPQLTMINVFWMDLSFQGSHPTALLAGIKTQP